MGRSKLTGNELFRALHMLGMSQEKLGDLLTVKQATVSRWVTGKQPVPGYVEQWLKMRAPELYSQITGRASDE